MSDLLLTEFLAGPFARLRLAGKSLSCRRQYRIQLGHFGRFLGHAPRLSDLTDDNLAGLLGWIVGNGRAPATANKARNHLLSLWRFAARKSYVTIWPDVQPLVEPLRIPQAWTLEQLSRLYGACLAEPGYVSGVQAAAWWYALHRVWLDTGERTSATLAVKWDWLDLPGRWLTVPAEFRKGGIKELCYRLKPETVEALKLIRQPKRKLVFVWPFSLATFYRRYEKILERAELPTDRKSKPQRMRRSFASHLEAAGGNATEALAHSSRKVTVQSYIDPRIAQQQYPTDIMPDVPEPDRRKQPPPLAG